MIGPSFGEAPPPVSADKYSALADLESAFSAPTVTTTSSIVNWDSSWTNRSTQPPSWAESATTGSVFGSSGGNPASSGFLYAGGGVVSSGTAATGFSAATGLT